MSANAVDDAGVPHATTQDKVNTNNDVVESHKLDGQNADGDSQSSTLKAVKAVKGAKESPELSKHRSDEASKSNRVPEKIHSNNSSTSNLANPQLEVESEHIPKASSNPDGTMPKPATETASSQRQELPSKAITDAKTVTPPEDTTEPSSNSNANKNQHLSQTLTESQADTESGPISQQNSKLNSTTITKNDASKDASPPKDSKLDDDELRHRDWREKRDAEEDPRHRYRRRSRSPPHRHRDSYRDREHDSNRRGGFHKTRHYNTDHHKNNNNDNDNDNDVKHTNRFPRKPYHNYRDNIKFNPASQPESSDPDDIRAQVEFYFSDSNLPTDAFLLSQVGGPDNRPVPIKTIHNFKRMRRFQPYSAVVAALRDSELLTVTADEEIQRKTPLPSNTKADAFENQRDLEDVTMARSVYVKGFGEENATTQFDIEAFLAPYGPTNAIRLRRSHPEKIFKGSVFVEFDSEDTAKAFLELQNKPKWEGNDLLVKSKTEYMKESSERNKKHEDRSGSSSFRGRGPARGRGFSQGGRGRFERGRGRGGRGGGAWSDRRRDRDRSHSRSRSRSRSPRRDGHEPDPKRRSRSPVDRDRRRRRRSSVSGSATPTEKNKSLARKQDREQRPRRSSDRYNSRSRSRSPVRDEDKRKYRERERDDEREGQPRRKRDATPAASGTETVNGKSECQDLGTKVDVDVDGEKKGDVLKTGDAAPEPVPEVPNVPSSKGSGKRAREDDDGGEGADGKKRAKGRDSISPGAKGVKTGGEG